MKVAPVSSVPKLKAVEPLHGVAGMLTKPSALVLALLRSTVVVSVWFALLFVQVEQRLLTCKARGQVIVMTSPALGSPKVPPLFWRLRLVGVSGVNTVKL
jgi:hypothetical protein